ncbi:UNVERIFIED_CONTAM: ABC transporter permease [Halobacillus marinus]
MNMAWKEMKKNKARFLLLGSIVFLLSLMTFILSGLSEGLSEDNVSLVKQMPDKTFHLNAGADGSYAQSTIPSTEAESGIFAFSIQMGTMTGDQEEKHTVAFFSSNEPEQVQQVGDGEVILDSSLKKEGLSEGEWIKTPLLKEPLRIAGFTDHKRFNHSPVALLNESTYQRMTGLKEWQVLVASDEKNTTELRPFSKQEFLTTIPSYQAEQTTLTMIVWFLVGISGLLFAVFFYMMNVQKVGMYGILKALGLRTRTLFQMMWTQMGVLIVLSIVAAGAVSLNLIHLLPEGTPYSLSVQTVLRLSLVFFIVGFAGSTLSAVQIRRIDPLTAIQRGDA